MTEATPIVLFGAAGRMGRMILECAADAGEPYRLVAAVERPGHERLGEPLRGWSPAAPDGVILTDAPPLSVPPGTVGIDFSTAEGAEAHAEWAVAARAGLVIGTTGLGEADRRAIQTRADATAILISPNMSVGVNVLFEIADRVARLLGPDFDVEVMETHHRFKHDAPSGTAIRLVEILRQTRGFPPEAVRHGRQGLLGERPAGEIGVHALRGGDVVGDHTVVFAALGERLELTHRAHTRQTFARGALRAARWLSGRAPGLYCMKDVLNLVDLPPIPR